jgi:hypothetical protein
MQIFFLKFYNISRSDAEAQRKKVFSLRRRASAGYLYKSGSHAWEPQKELSAG